MNFYEVMKELRDEDGLEMVSFVEGETVEGGMKVTRRWIVEGLSSFDGVASFDVVKNNQGANSLDELLTAMETEELQEHPVLFISQDEQMRPAERIMVATASVSPARVDGDVIGQIRLVNMENLAMEDLELFLRVDAMLKSQVQALMENING